MIVVTDANGGKLWSSLVESGKKVTLSVSGVSSSTATITWYTPDGSTVLQTQSAELKPQ